MNSWQLSKRRIQVVTLFRFFCFGRSLLHSQDQVAPVVDDAAKAAKFERHCCGVRAQASHWIVSFHFIRKMDGSNNTARNFGNGCSPLTKTPEQAGVCSVSWNRSEAEILMLSSAYLVRNSKCLRMHSSVPI